VDRAVRTWAEDLATSDETVVRVGYFGSYARGDWGVGSDLDVVIVVRESDRPFERRALRFDASALPVPADVFVYTTEEWGRMSAIGGLPRTVASQVVWVSGAASE
jgi:predicted nucleotidyltransferase